MLVLRILKILFLGIIGQILLWSLLSLFLPNERDLDIYWPWIIGGEWLFPSGPAGHAMPLGAMLGFFLGFIAYSIPIGYGIDRLIKSLIGRRQSDN